MRTFCSALCISCVISLLCSLISCKARCSFSVWKGGMVLRSVCANSSSKSRTTCPVLAILLTTQHEVLQLCTVMYKWRFTCQLRFRAQIAVRIQTPQSARAGPLRQFTANSHPSAPQHACDVWYKSSAIVRATQDADTSRDLRASSNACAHEVQESPSKARRVDNARQDEMLLVLPDQRALAAHCVRQPSRTLGRRAQARRQTSWAQSCRLSQVHSRTAALKDMRAHASQPPNARLAEDCPSAAPLWPQRQVRVTGHAGTNVSYRQHEYATTPVSLILRP